MKLLGVQRRSTVISSQHQKLSYAGVYHTLALGKLTRPNRAHGFPVTVTWVIAIGATQDAKNGSLIRVPSDRESLLRFFKFQSTNVVFPAKLIFTKRPLKLEEQDKLDMVERPCYMVGLST